MTADRGRIEELLSGALDGALTEAEAQELERALELEPTLRAYQARLEEAVALLQETPPVEPSTRLLARISERLKALSAADAAPALSELDIELISASRDGALTPDEAERVEDLLATNPAAAELYERLEASQAMLGQLELVEPSADFLPWLDETLDDCARIERAELDRRFGEARWQWLKSQAGPLSRWFVAVAASAALALLLVQALPTNAPPRELVRPEHPLDEVESPPSREPGETPRDPVTPPPSGEPRDPSEGRPATPGEGLLEGPGGLPGEGGQPQAPVEPLEVIAGTDGEPVTPPREPGPKGTGTVTDPRVERPGDLDLEALERLLALIRNPRTQPEARNAAVAQLGAFPHERALALLRELMGGRFAGLPRARELYEPACDALATMDTLAAAQVLWMAPVISEPAPVHPSVVAGAVGRLRDGDALAWLATQAASDLSGERPFAVLKGLGWRGNSAAAAPIREALEKRFASRHLTESELKHQGAQLQHREMALTLGRMGDESSLTLLSQVADAGTRADMVLREGAALALGELQLPGAVAALAAPLGESGKGHVGLRSCAARALARYSDPQALELLITRLGKERNGLVVNAIEGALFELTGLRQEGSEGWSRWWAESREAWSTVERAQAERPTGTLPPLSDGIFGLPGRGRCLLFILDASASMAFEGRFERACAELSAALDVLGRQARPKSPIYFNILIFSETNKLLLSDPRNDFVMVSPRSIEKAKADLERVRVSRTRTDILAALETALGLQRELDTVILISDGRATQGEARTEAMLYDLERLNRARQVVFHTVGIYDPSAELYIDLRPAVRGDEGLYKRFLRQIPAAHGGFFVSNHPRPK